MGAVAVAAAVVLTFQGSDRCAKSPYQTLGKGKGKVQSALHF
jgi:hypothetical protein